MTLDLRSIRALSFDCYGTLIDWERGILATLGEVFESRAIHADSDELLETFATIEPRVERDGFRPYREVLGLVLDELGEEYGFPTSHEEQQAFGASVSTWPAFPDSVAALAALRERYALFVLSNVDADLFTGTAALLGNPFTQAFTADQIGSYKPDPRNFEYLLARLDADHGIAPGELLHVAQSRYHDIAPAKELGLATVWVNRRGDAGSGGATAPSDAVADLEVPSMAALAELAAAACS
ncbi:MAG: haloacid dehalogenase type II [Planctomycetota bacterium]|nr:haloacid dehalogenase type II [Planctomycetota bacterium]